jgi:hypothetical protein
MTRIRRAVSVILAGTLFCVGLVLLFIYFTSVEVHIAHRVLLLGGITCVSVGAVWIYSDLFGKD